MLVTDRRLWPYSHTALSCSWQFSFMSYSPTIAACRCEVCIKWVSEWLWCDVCVCNSAKVPLSNTVSSQDDIRPTSYNDWRVTETQLPPPSESSHTKHGIHHTLYYLLSVLSTYLRYLTVRRAALWDDCSLAPSSTNRDAPSTDKNSIVSTDWPSNDPQRKSTDGALI